MTENRRQLLAAIKDWIGDEINDRALDVIIWAASHDEGIQDQLNNEIADERRMARNERSQICSHTNG